MLDSYQKSTGTRYTMTVALLLVAFIFSPAVLIASSPFGYVSVLLALACTALCVTLARVNWKGYSQVTIPSLEAPMRGRNDPSMRIQGANPYAISSTPLRCAADPSNYRGFQFGTNLAAAAK